MLCDKADERKCINVILLVDDDYDDHDDGSNRGGMGLARAKGTRKRRMICFPLYNLLKLHNMPKQT